MKIGYLLQEGVPNIREYPPSGPANHVLHVCSGLMRQGHQVRLLARLDKRVWKTDDLVNYEPVVVPSLDRGAGRLLERAVRRAQSTLKLPYFALFDSLRFAAACCKELADYDLLYERMGWMGGGGSFAARIMKVPHILEINGDHSLEHEMLGFSVSGFQWQLSNLLMRRVAHAATHTVATGEGWRRSYIDQWGVDPSKVSVVQNGSAVVDLLKRSDLRCFSSGANTAGPLELIYVGSFDPWQNLEMLLETVSRAVLSGTEVRLTLAGTGILRDKLERLRKELCLDEEVTFAGHVPMEELLRLLRRAHVGVSLYEGRQEFTGLKLLDYKSAGLATIATGANGEPSSIAHGRTGIVIAPGDGEALLKAILEFERVPGLAARFGRAARIEAEQQHSWQHTVEELERRFEQILNFGEDRSRGLVGAAQRDRGKA